MTEINIDGKTYEVKEGQNLLQAILTLGLDLPYFCWHPAMGSVGACRQCAVIQYRDEKDIRGKLVMACMTPVQAGLRVSIGAREAAQFRTSVIEWLMVNHPHDCPVCDEGGECHLQDMTVMTGHNYREYRFKKRTHRNQYLGPFINHEMNRCIACYRCVRFYREYAGGNDLNVFAAHHYVYFGRHEDGVLESEFSGNLVEVCPTGVFTDKTLKKHYTRKWDLQTAPSVCHHCGLGCNTIPGERYGLLRRILNRYNRQVNGYFLCDRGRFGYEFVNSERRVREPLRRQGKEKDKGVQKIAKEQAVKQIACLMANQDKVIGIGSPRASLESNYALRTLVGPDRFYSGLAAKDNHLISMILNVLRTGPVKSASLHDVGRADAVLVLGEDLTNTAPRLALALHQAVRNKLMPEAEKLGIPRWNDAAIREAMQDKRGPLYVIIPTVTKLDRIATATYYTSPDEIARMGFALANVLDSRAPGVRNFKTELRPLVKNIAEALRNAKHPLIISGISLGNAAVIQAATNVAWALFNAGKQAQICFTMPECNSLGTAFLGGGGLEKAFEEVRSQAADTVIIMENDLYRRADALAVDEFLANCKQVIVLDYVENATTERSDLILPACSFAEGDGTLINNEGRAQRFFQVINPGPALQESWRWIRELMLETDREEARSWISLDAINKEMVSRIPAFDGKVDVAPDALFRIDDQKIPRAPQRYSGRTAMDAHINVHEPQPPEDPDSPLSFSMEGYQGQPPSPLIPFFWAPAWNSVQATNKYQSEVGGPLRGGDPGVRLIEPKEKAKVVFFKEFPQAVQLKKKEWLVIPLYHIFGSEELSTMAAGVSQLVPSPYLALGESETEKLQIDAASEVILTLNQKEYRLPVRICKGLPRGVAGLPSGLPGTVGIVLPAWGKIRLAE